MTTQHRDWFPAALVFAEAGLYLANDMYLPAMPNISIDLLASANWVQLTLTLFFLGLALCYPIIGPFSDRFGRRPIVLLGLLIFIVTGFGCAFSPNIISLIFWRFFQGSTIAFVVVAGYSAIHECYDQKQAIVILAWMSSITVLAPALGPLIGSGILLFTNWRMLFLLQIIWGVLALVFVQTQMPKEGKDHQRHSLELRRILTSYLAILKNRTFTLNALGFSGLFSGFIAWIAAGAFIVINDYHYTPVEFGLFQCAIFSSYIAGTIVVRYLVESLSANHIIDLGLLLAGLGAALCLILSLIMPDQFVVFIVMFMLFSFGCGISFSSLGRVSIEASDEPMGARMAMLTTLMAVGNVASTALISVFHDSLLYFSWILLIFTVLGIAARAWWVYTKWKKY